MVICDLCASANNEFDESCRVCGQELKTNASAPAPVPAGAAGVSAVTGPPSSDHVPPSALQVSAVKSAPQTGVPPMIDQQREQEHEVSAPATTAMPGFMQTARSSESQPESVQLISASDLPDWIKQIAAADEAKAAAEAEAAISVDQPATILRRPLPGETHVGGPSTNWLSKSGAGAEPTEHWGSTEAANANWGNPESPGAHVPAQSLMAAQVPPIPVVNSADTYSYSKPKGRFSRPERSQSSSSKEPIYRRQSVQLAALIVLLALLAFTML